MKRNRILEAFGYRYIYNKNTGEVHDTKKLKPNCQFHLMKGGYYISKRKARSIINNYTNDACKWCIKDEKVN